MGWRYAVIPVIIAFLAAGSGTAQVAGSAQAAPWADRGWVAKGKMTYDNPKHGFHLIVPGGWVIDKEERYPSTYLWSMAKFDAAGNLRVQVAIRICPCQVKTAQEFYEAELAAYKEPPFSSQLEVVSSGQTGTSGVYEIQLVRKDSGHHGRDLFFLRKGTPYIVDFLWAPDASSAELAELNSVRRTMGLPKSRTTSVPPSPVLALVPGLFEEHPQPV